MGARVADAAGDPRRQPDLRRARRRLREPDPDADQRRGAAGPARRPRAGEGEALIVYADLGCPHCASAWAELVARARRRSSSATSRSPASTRARRPCTPPPRRRDCRATSSRWSTRSTRTAATSTTRTSGERAERLGLDLERFERRPPLRRGRRRGSAATSNPASAPGSPAPPPSFPRPVLSSVKENESSESRWPPSGRPEVEN